MTDGGVIEAWCDAFGALDGERAAALLAGGSYTDPTTGSAAAADAAAASMAAWRLAVPDARVECTVSVTRTGALVEWVLRGTHTGTWRDIGMPSGRTVRLEGVDILEVVAASRGLRVRRHYDQVALAAQFGLDTLMHPVSSATAQFGYSMRVASGNPRPPGAVALTWIEAADEGEKARIRAHSRQNVADFLQEPGFIAIVTGFTGLRGFTVTAWADEAAMRRALGRHHVEAMDQLFNERFVASVWTSVWQPTRLNRLWVRCRACGSLQDVTHDHRGCTTCTAALPPRPAFW